MKAWIEMDEYKGFKVGDSVKRNDGGRDVNGKLWDTEGVIVSIQQWHEKKKSVWFDVAVNGNLGKICILNPKQVKKIDKRFKMHDNGKMKLF